VTQGANLPLELLTIANKFYRLLPFKASDKLFNFFIARLTFPTGLFHFVALNARDVLYHFMSLKTALPSSKFFKKNPFFCLAMAQQQLKENLQFLSPKN